MLATDPWLSLGPVLVADDGTDHGADALALGRRLGHVLGREVAVGVAYDAFALSSRYLVQARREEAAAIAVGDQALVPGDAPAVHVVGGPVPAETLSDLARRLDACALVVGRSHRAGFPAALGGSTTRGVVLEAPCPIAVAPTGARPRVDAPIRRIALAHRDDPGARGWIDQAAHLARAARAKLELVAVTGDDGSLLDRERLESELVGAARLVPTDVACCTRVLHGSPAGALRGLAGEVDLLVLGSPQRAGLRRALLGDVALHLAAEAPFPLLVLPAAGVATASRTSRRPLSGDGPSVTPSSVGTP